MNSKDLNVLLMNNTNNNVTTQTCTIAPVNFSNNNNKISGDVNTKTLLLAHNNGGVSSSHNQLDDSRSSSESSSINEIRNEIKLRNLCSDDIPDLKRLCAEWFPVDYPESWYKDITSNKRFYSIAAIHRDKIVGMIVAEIKTKQATNVEDWHILSNKHPFSSQVTYILSIGVNKELRRMGIASMLLDTLLEYLRETDCKAVYLHVLCSNQGALNFYRKRNFQQRIYLPNYYTINGQFHDGYCYVLYMNNGQPPWAITYPLTYLYNIIYLFVRRFSVNSS